MNSYRYTPPKKTKGAATLSLSLLGAAIVFLLLSRFLRPSALFQLSALVACFFFLRILLRYLLSDYTYTFEDGQLSFSLFMGKRTQSLGAIRPKKGDLLLTKAQWEEKKKECSPVHRFSFQQNLFSPDLRFLLFTGEDGKLTLLSFEPDAELTRLIEAVIE